MSLVPLRERHVGIVLEARVVGSPSTFTHGALEPTRQWTFSGGAGSGVSIALACGCTSSGHVGSQAHSALPQWAQK